MKQFRKLPRQHHGFHYENQVISKFNLIKSEDYLSKFDATTINETPIQIKCMKQNSEICLGDLKRNQTITTDFILIVGFWKSNRYKIVEEHILYIDHEKYIECCKFDRLTDFIAELKVMSNDPEDDQKWKVLFNQIKSEYPKKNIIKIRPKRDHRKQKRIQCSVSYKKFKSEFLKIFETVDLGEY